MNAAKGISGSFRYPSADISVTSAQCWLLRAFHHSG